MRLLLIIAALLPAVASSQDAPVKQCAAHYPVGVARARCLAPWLDDMVARQGAGSALEAAERLVRTGVMNDCHVMAHTIGHASWQKTRQLSTAFASCTKACVQGCMHGVMEAAMKGGAGAIGSKEALAFCDALGGGTLERRQCLHGIGHGIMHQRKDDLPAALAECEGLGERYERDQCLGGMWMQWAHFPVDEGAEAFSKKAPGLCAAVRRDQLGQCAYAVGGAAMFATGHNAARSQAICKRMPLAQQARCRDGVQYEVELLQKGGGHAHQH